MLFHTLPFLLFMAVALPGFYALRRTPLWAPWLLAASYFFYGWWNPWYLLLVVYSTGLDFLLVLLMDHCPARGEAAPDRRDRTLRWSLAAFGSAAAALAVGAVVGPAALRPTLLAFTTLVGLMALGAALADRRMWLLISLFNNLFLLLFFKYARFVATNLNALLGSLGSPLTMPDPASLTPPGWEYLLPVGISFFTFQSMSYTIDFYLGRVERERSLLRFATFVCFFPQLMAGPIERARNMLPQFRQAQPFRLQNLTDGLSLFLVGLFKKLALANYLSLYVERVYSDPASFGSPDLLLATFAFAWQIFFDFSGYTDMARGVARMMGFHLTLNFRNPYTATGLGDFWQRWHISLSSWFRDYVYIPLGGSRSGKAATYRNLFITFLVSGIWHGANWTFAVWGVMHAVGVIATRELERSPFYHHRVPRLLKQAGVFAYVCLAWVFFRAADVPQALLILRGMFAGPWMAPGAPGLMLALVGGVWDYQFAYESRWRPMLAAAPVRVGLAACMALYLALCSSGGGAFIYFQF